MLLIALAAFKVSVPAPALIIEPVLPVPITFAKVTLFPLVSITPPIEPFPGVKVIERVEISTVLPVAYCKRAAIEHNGPGPQVAKVGELQGTGVDARGPV